MTAESSEKEAESRLKEDFSPEVSNTGGQDGDPSGPREGLEGGRNWDNGNSKDRDRDAGFGNGYMNNGFSGSSDLNVEAKESRADVEKAARMDIDAEVQGRPDKKKRLPTRDVRVSDTTPSTEEDRDEETEDDFEEGDCVMADAASKHHPQQGPSHPQAEEQPGKGDRSQCQKQQQQEEQQPQAQPKQEPHGQEAREQQQQPPPKAVVVPAGWESFLPRKHIRVLLAEDDDSTRHVVGALLRNCGYEVTSAANGMQAWEMLEDPNNFFDLVLTDVVMPCLSGVGLLTKIMSREAGKRIPVIMMSSHDSLDIVYRCLFKGAADFLVKPVRKNELKNLWQHVWRCQSSSGSGSGGSGSGSGMRKFMQPKSRVGSGNNSGSNDGSEDGSSGLNVRGGSDNGSGTQTVAEHVQTREKQKRDQEEGQATSLQKASDEQMGQDLEMATRRPGVVELQEAEQEKQLNDSAALDNGSPSSSNRNDVDQMEEGYNSGAANSGGSAKAIDLIGGIACQNNEDRKEGEDSDGVEGSDRGASNSPVMNDKYASGTSMPTLELSLKRSRVPGDDDVEVEERRAVRQSGGSAFSRYSTSGVIIQQHLPSGNNLALGTYSMGGAYSLSAGQSGLASSSKTGQLHHSTAFDRCGSFMGSGEASTPHANPPHLPPKGSGQDLGSGVVGTSGQDGYANSRQIKDEAASASPASAPGIPISRAGVPPPAIIYDGVCASYGPPMHPSFYSHPAAPPWATGPAHKSNRGEVFDHPPYREHGTHASHHHSHHHQPHRSQHHHHHHTNLPQSSVRSMQDDQTVQNPGAGAPRCGSSNMAGSVPDGNTGQSGSSNGNNGSVNGSASGSNNLSNENGQSGVPLPPNTNAGCGGNNGESGSGNGAVNAGAVDPEQNRFARREAALNKFRQKRKERCFEKKVRYQSRKRLAEQRPRVRGQFVRQTVYDVNTGEAVE
ncbi:pseudo-response regulator 7 [Marchantia polymorpha subsp. ruderalis]